MNTMIPDRLWRLLEELVFPVPSTDVLFNQYRDEHPAFDLPGAAEIRRENLRNYLDAFPDRPRVMVFGEAPGPWGARFSGVPITSESQLLDPTFPIHGRQSGQGAPHREYCAGIYWRVVQPHFPSVFMWNTVPFHPHHREKPLSIRTPTSREIRSFAEVVRQALDIVQPEKVVALGRKAESVLESLGHPHTYVRHPSQGGAKAFEQGITEIILQH